MKYLLLTTFTFLLLQQAVFSGSTEKAPLQIKAKRLSETIQIDGLLNETVWQNGTCVRDFLQRNPNEGAAPTERTEVRIAYDEQALYIGARMYDHCPDSILARLSRRDTFEDTDLFGFFIDPYHDKRSGYYFAISAGGTLGDGVLLNDDWDDDSWDGVWEAKANIDDKGWTAEFKVPFSQLRFKSKENYVWGINFRRDIARKNEEIFLVYTPKDGSGFVSRFAHLTGIQGVEHSNNIEVLPYFRTKAEYTNPAAGNPFNDGSRYLPGFGADFKFGLSSNLTLNGTINPDFGQVEVDPAVVNLSDVETYFQEKRPFFIEGASIFRFGYGGSRSNWGFNWGNPSFFYSRRIGRTPSGSLPGYDYSDKPDGTKILGAAKLTGKLGDNWNIGAVHAVTAREYARIQTANSKESVEVEPRTHYSIARVQKEIDEGYRGIGLIATNTLRNFKDTRLENEMNKQALSLGLDGWTFLDDDRVWVVTAWGGMSQVWANKQQMTNLQQNSRHYFQRPDMGFESLDTNRTSLRGYAGRILVNKQKGNVIFNSAVGFIDPRFDVNDLGFMWRTNIINAHMGLGYKWTKPGNLFRYSEVVSAVFESRDFDNNKVWSGVWAMWYARFLNYYSLRMNTAYNPSAKNIYRTRGGPITKNKPGYQFNLFASSDNRKPLVFGLGGFTYYTSQRDWTRQVELDFEWKPLDNIRVAFNPSFRWSDDFSMWVNRFEDKAAGETYGYRYVFADMQYTSFSSSIRLNWTFSPGLSLQFYVQPLISSGDYSRFKYLDRPNSHSFTEFGTGNSTISYESGTYSADADGDGEAATLEWSNPDFNTKSLRGNAVLRWEYLPGSTLYLVWTQSRRDYQNTGQFQFNRSLDRMIEAEADNIFMVKWTYWWNL